MTACDRLSDRMASVARGDGGWSAEEAAHLTGCPDCRAEWRVVQAARGLGRGHLVDADLVARDVMARLAADGATRPSEVSIASRRRPWVWVAALAAAAVLAVAAPNRRPAGPRPAAAPAVAATGGPSVLSELDDLSAGELEWVFDEVDDGSVGADADRARTGDLTPAELERVLRSWEG